MKFFLRLCLLIALGIPLLLLFAIMIAVHGDRAADDMVVVLDNWLTS